MFAFLQGVATKPDFGPAATIIAALIGAVSGAGVAYMGWILPERGKRKGLVADFLDAIGKDVTNMIDLFEKDQIPHRAGNSLDVEIDFFEKATNRQFLSNIGLDTLSELRLLSREAENVDLYLYQGDNGKTLRDKWIARARPIVGRLDGEARRLKTGL